MNKRALLCFLVSSALLLGAGCNRTSQITPPTTSPTMTSSVEVDVSSTTVMSDVTTTMVTTTVSLVDRPVSEWPRYEFKELGFSMQLPFVKNSNQASDYHECDGKTYKEGCWTTELGKPFTWYAGSAGEGTLTAVSEFYNRESEWSLSFVRDFSYKNGSYFIEQYKVNPLSTLTINKFNILVFDASKDIYAKYGDTSYGVPDDDVTAMIRLPQHPFFKSAILSFPAEKISLNVLKTALKTLQKTP